MRPAASRGHWAMGRPPGHAATGGLIRSPGFASGCISPGTEPGIFFYHWRNGAGILCFLGNWSWLRLIRMWLDVAASRLVLDWVMQKVNN